MLRRVRRVLGVAVLGAILGAGVVAPAHAEGGAVAASQPPDDREPATGKWPQKPHWDPEWSHSNAWDYTLAGVGATALALEAIFMQNSQPSLRWTDPILFDREARDLLRIDNSTSHDVAQTLSWVLWGAQIALPVAVDVPYAWARYGFGLARDLFWQDAVTLFVTAALDLALRDLAGRARPFVWECIERGGTDCIYGPEAVRSFPGGHFLNSTAASVLTCTQHLYVHLYGGAWDGLTCAMTLASDATVGILRIATDSHWASDELVGAVAGALLGWGIPYVMHFMPKSAPDAKPPAALVLPMPIALDRGGGLGVAGFV